MGKIKKLANNLKWFTLGKHRKEKWESKKKQEEAQRKEEERIRKMLDEEGPPIWKRHYPK